MKAIFALGLGALAMTFSTRSRVVSGVSGCAIR